MGPRAPVAAPTPLLPTAASFLSGSFRVKLVCHSVPLLPPLSSVFPKKRKREELESLSLETSGVFLLHSVPSPHPRTPRGSTETLPLRTRADPARARQRPPRCPRSLWLPPGALQSAPLCSVCVLFGVVEVSFMFHCAGAERTSELLRLYIS